MRASASGARIRTCDMLTRDETGISNNEFVCDVCQMLRNVTQLDDDIAHRYGVSKDKVLDVVQAEDPLLCKECASMLEDARHNGVGRRKDDHYQWYLDFDDTDRLEQRRYDWLRQNY